MKVIKTKDGIEFTITKRGEGLHFRKLSPDKSVHHQVLESIYDQSGVPDFEPHHEYVGPIGFDSLDAIEHIMDVEERFGIHIPDKDAEGLKTPQHMIDYVKSKTGLK